MIDFGFDFTGRHVVVTGGTRGVGLATAQAFAEAGAQVSITGTKVLPSMYDADLRAFSFHQLQLTNSDAIEGFVETIDHVDVLVNAAGARLSGNLDAHEREFVAHSARHGFIGPAQLANKLRHRISSSQFPGGGSVIHTPACRQWLELTHPPAEAAAELAAQTRRAGATWGRVGARVNTVLDSPTLSVPAQPRQTPGALLTRSRVPVRVAARDVASIVLFLASSGASAITGQTVHVGL